MFAVLHLADFALQAVLRLEPPGPAGPAADGAPAALFTGGRKSVVLAASAAARHAGVAPGMTAPQAVARCPALLIRAPHPAAEAEARAALHAAAWSLSPLIEDTASGVCTVDLRGTDPSGHPAAARTAIGRLSSLGLAATAGFARTPLLALYAARAAETPSSVSTPSSGLPPPSRPDHGSGENRPEENGRVAAPVRLLSPADEAAFLAAQPLATADPPPELAPILALWGLRTLGDLTALPCEEIVRRFGTAGLALWQRAAGGDLRPLRPVAPPREFVAATEFEDPVETLEPLLFLLRRWLDRLALELQHAHRVAADLSLTLTLDPPPSHTRTFRLPAPTADATLLFRALHTHLETLQTESPITGLRLVLSPTRPLVRQPGLFETGLRDPHGFAETLARLSALVGTGCLGTPVPEDTHRPDAVKLVPPPAVVPPPALPPVHVACGLPLRRFRPPLPARLEFVAGDNRPAYVWTEPFHGAITDLRGPWCSSGDWWQADRTWARAEWDVALAGGGLYRLLRTGDAWFIEGEYD